MNKTRITIENTPDENNMGRIEELRIEIGNTKLHIDKEDDYNFIYKSKKDAEKALVEVRKKLIEKKLWDKDASVCNHIEGFALTYYNARAIIN
ncbi:MAG: hypothetical protein LBM08_15120 [Dysgonamonadaceae bacterium]|jgi:hypothetical protein|nr:hypothetical protein [Dysgonamonadaceae bacterium]